MIKLPRLPVGYAKVPGLFERYWDQAMSNIETAVNQVLAIPAIEAAIAAANSAANNANAAANATKIETSIANSYVLASSFTPPLISCDSAGEVSVATHTRVYGDTALNPSRTVTGATFTVSGVIPGDIIRVYYNDTPRTGGTVSYYTTVDRLAAPLAQTGNRHSVGAVEVPNAGSNDGNYAKPPGFVFV